jgi:heme/copper-type cytochrome/quinol oxidase subunit 4
MPIAHSIRSGALRYGSRHRTVLVVWLVLAAATLTSFWVGTDHDQTAQQLRGLAIIGIAIIKIRLVGLYFMELRQAPTPLRGLFEAYCVTLFAAMAALYVTT